MKDTRNDSRAAGIVRFLAGTSLCLSGLLLGSAAIGSLIAPDGIIAGEGKLLAIRLVRIALVLAGLFLFVRGGKLRLTSVALVLGICASGAGAWARLGARSAADAPKAPGAPDDVFAGRPGILPLGELCGWLTKEDPRVGTDASAEYEAALQRALEGPGDAPDPIRIAVAREELADILLRQGRNDEVIDHLERALAGLLDAGAPSDSVNRVRRSLGVAHLRAGEISHCIEMHNPERCMFPIEGAGVWTETGGARAAIGYFEAYLTDRPRDLDVRWMLNIAYMVVGEYPDGVPASWLIPREAFGVADPAVAGVGRFEDVAPSAGVATFSRAGGAILDDFDDDGYLDVFTSTTSPCEPARYYHNRGDGTFEDWTERSALSDQVGGFNCAQADYDNDGRLDVYMLRGAWLGRIHGTQRNSLLHQREDGTFEDVTLAAGMGRTAYPTQVGVWADYDLDGDVDLFVGNEFFPAELYRNEGDGSFTDVAASAGVINEDGKDAFRCVKGANWGDYDNDGDPDLFVANYGQPNRLYRNQGDGSFTDVAPDFGLDRPAYDLRTDPGPARGMTSALGKDFTAGSELDLSFNSWWWDYDNDGWLDLYVGGYGAALEDMVADYIGEPTAENRRLKVYRNLRGQGFENVAPRLGLDRVRLPMGANFGDVDNDGWLDFYLGTGRPPFDYLMPNILYRSIRGERFVDVTTAAGVGHLQKGHGVAFGDVDNDGDQDILAQMGGAFPADAFHDSLFANPGNENHWVTVVLRGVRSNRDGIGTRLEVTVETPSGPREIHITAGSGGSFGASSLQQEIGLGDAARISKLVVSWPASGVVQEFSDVPLDAFVQVNEDESEVHVLAREAFRF